MSTNPGDITRLLHQFRDGDKEAFEQVIPMVYDELRRIARRHLARNQRGATLNTTALVHEVYLKMADQKRLDVKDRGHFLAVAARAMRQVIISHARARQAEKRGGGQAPVTLDEGRVAIEEQAQRLLDLNQALERLAERNERLAQVVECRFFAGLSEEETAEALDISLRTAQRDWMRAKAWIREEMTNADSE